MISPIAYENLTADQTGRAHEKPSTIRGKPTGLRDERHVWSWEVTQVSGPYGDA